MSARDASLQQAREPDEELRLHQTNTIFCPLLDFQSFISLEKLCALFRESCVVGLVSARLRDVGSSRPDPHRVTTTLAFVDMPRNDVRVRAEGDRLRIGMRSMKQMSAEVSVLA